MILSRGRKGRGGSVLVKLERSRQSARWVAASYPTLLKSIECKVIILRECRARKKLRYQYVDDIILAREKANDKLRDELTR